MSMMFLVCTMLYTSIGTGFAPSETDTASVSSVHHLPEASVAARTHSLREYHSIDYLSAVPSQAMERDRIRFLGLDEVSDVLKQMNGLWVKDYGGLGGMKTVSVRHLGAHHTGVMLDGIPVSNCQSGQIDLARFHTEQLQEVHFDIGSPQDLLCPASMEATSGLVEMVSARPEQSYVRLSYGSWNTLRASVETPFSDRLSFSADFRHTDGDYPFELVNGNRRTRERRNNGQVNAVSAQLNGRLQWRNSSLEGKLYGWLDHSHLPGGVILYNDVSREKNREQNLLAQGRFLRTWADGKMQMQILAKYNGAATRYFDGALLNASTATVQHTFHYRQHEGYGSAGWFYDARREGTSLQASLVTDATLSTFSSDLPTNPEPLRHSHHTVLRLRCYGNRWQTNASLLRADIFDDTARGIHRWAPSVSALWQCWHAPYRDQAHPLQDVSFRASARSAFRMPSFNDLYYYRIGNLSLRPETSAQYNLGFASQWRVRQWWGTLTADIYRHNIENKIVAIPTAFAWKMHNYGRCRMQGLEVSLESCLRLGHQETLTMTAGWQLCEAVSRTDRQSDYYGMQLPYTPRHSGHAALSYNHRSGFSAGYTLQWMSSRQSLLSDSWRYRLEPYADQSLTLCQRLGNWDFRLSCQNLFDAHYEVVQFYPMPGRQWSVGVGLRLD